MPIKEIFRKKWIRTFKKLPKNLILTHATDNGFSVILGTDPKNGKIYAVKEGYGEKCGQIIKGEIR